jgi:hypothetical protein
VSLPHPFHVVCCVTVKAGAGDAHRPVSGYTGGGGAAPRFGIATAGADDDGGGVADGAAARYRATACFSAPLICSPSVAITPPGESAAMMTCSLRALSD